MMSPDILVKRLDEIIKGQITYCGSYVLSNIVICIKYGGLDYRVRYNLIKRFFVNICYEQVLS